MSSSSDPYDLLKNLDDSDGRLEKEEKEDSATEEQTEETAAEEEAEATMRYH